MPTRIATGSTRAGAGGVHPALIGLVMLFWARTTAGREVALWRCRIFAEEALIGAEGLPAPRAWARLNDGLIRIAAVAQVALENEK
jgi:hypothetical protein